MGPDEPFAGLTASRAWDAAAWLPTEDLEARRAILGWLTLIACTGVDPVVALREAMPLWFGAAAGDLLPDRSPAGVMTEGGISPTPDTMALEPLPPLPRPTLWPQRPKRLPDELFSSWLWRASVAAGAPPARFARDTIGACHGDADAEVSELVLCRLALASGQPVAYLAAGTLSAFGDRVPVSCAEVVQEALLRHACPLLARSGRSGRPRAVLQYCPRCLALGPEPYFPRGWRFAVEAVCVRHRCRLHDACWRCGAVVDPLAQKISSRQPVCATCGAVLAEAAARPARDAVRPQRGLMCVLYHAAACFDDTALRHHVGALSKRFPPGSRVAERERSLAGLLPSKIDRWFGPVADRQQRDRLQHHAQGNAYGAWFGSVATSRTGDVVDLPPLSRIRPLSRERIPRDPWFTASPALRKNGAGRHRPPA